MEDFIRNTNMKRVYMIGAIIVFACQVLSAQQAELHKAAERFRGIRSLKADVVQTRHNVALIKDITTSGHFFYQEPDRCSMAFPDVKEMLLAVDDTFVMVRDGKQHAAKAKGQGNNPFEVLSDVFRKLLSADEHANLSEYADVKLSRQGNSCTITISPIEKNARNKRRMMYASCIVTVDLKAAELRCVRIYERGENYTQYDFSNYAVNAEVDANAFDVQSVM